MNNMAPSNSMPAPPRKLAKDVITLKGPAAIQKHYNLPKTLDTQVWFWSGCDKTLKFSERLALELKWLPLANKRYGEGKGPELNKKELFIMILIRNFNEACQEFLYVIKGPENMTKLLKMVFAGQIWDEPCFATPIHMRTWNQLINTPGLDQDTYEQVMRTETKGMRFGCYFASAEKAYAQLKFSAAKYDALRREVSNAPEVDSSSDTDSESVGLTDDELSDDEFSDDDMSDD